MSRVRVSTLSAILVGIGLIVVAVAALTSIGGTQPADRCPLDQGDASAQADDAASCDDTGEWRIYGPGVGWDAKGNIEISDGLAKAGIRFRATHSAQVAILRHAYKSAPVPYGAGNLGTYRVGFQAGSRDGPDGTWLGQPVRWDPPPTSSGDVVRHDLAVGPTLRAGSIYWVVWENLDRRPLRNYASLNFPYTFISPPPSPRQPRYTDDVLAVFNTYDGDWELDSRHFPAVDIEYTDGYHDGHGGIGVASLELYGTVDGTARARERFTPTSTVLGLTTVGWRLAHVSGTATADIEATLKVNGGETLGTAILPGSGLPSDSFPSSASSSGDWATGRLSGGPHTLRAGVEYVLELSTSVGSTYWSRPILMRDDTTSAGEHLHDQFAEGRAERSSDGTSWAPVVNGWAAYTHHQFYMR